MIILIDPMMKDVRMDIVNDCILNISLYQQKRFKELGITTVLTCANNEDFTKKARLDLINSYAVGCKSIVIANRISDEAKGIKIIITSKMPPCSCNGLCKAFSDARLFTNYCGYENNCQDFVIDECKYSDAYMITYGNIFDEVDRNLLIYHWPKLAEMTIKGLCYQYGVAYQKPDYFYHIIRNGESVNSICKLYNTTPSAFILSPEHFKEGKCILIKY